ncbi:hypothetical protein EDB85DRAFT_1879909, partial [Lactarius pseudohatsudake]
DRLSKSWDAPVYAFFKPIPSVEYVKNRKAHVFECTASPCRRPIPFVRRFVYTRDASSTSNLLRHAKLCWGDDALTAAYETCDLKSTREALRNHKGLNGSITAAFKRTGAGKVTYSHRQHTKLEIRAEFVCWVSENKRPFQVVNDRAFHSLIVTPPLA